MCTRLLVVAVAMMLTIPHGVSVIGCEGCVACCMPVRSASLSLFHSPLRCLSCVRVLHRVLAGAARARQGQRESTAEKCASGLALHGRGQWGQALQVFAAAVGDELAAGLTGVT